VQPTAEQFACFARTFAIANWPAYCCPNGSTMSGNALLRSSNIIIRSPSDLPSKIHQMKVSQESGSEANFGFGCALMPSLECIL